MVTDRVRVGVMVRVRRPDSSGNLLIRPYGVNYTTPHIAYSVLTSYKHKCKSAKAYENINSLTNSKIP